LGEVCEIVKGTSYSQNDLTSSQGIRIMRGGNINKITHNLDLLNNDVYVNQKLFSSAKQVHKNDIIITSTNDIDNIAKCAFVNKDVDNAQIGAFLRIVRISESLNAKYVFFIFASAFYETYIQCCVSGTVSSLLNIRDEYINNLKIPLPPLKEQEKIVKI
ncbi:hypothetical protein FMM54_01235, partial [Campylobacter sp. LR185c]|uniref:restriction endonuclease subunit S n=1 Tax=Campylobacter sp. LR185c TaxID=2014525 RepID=UPI00126F4CDB